MAFGVSVSGRDSFQGHLKAWEPAQTHVGTSLVPCSHAQDMSKYYLHVEPEIGDTFYLQCCAGKGKMDYVRVS